MGNTEADSEEKAKHTMVPTDKMCIVVIFCIVDASLGIFFSLLAPFFPNEAATKGSSTIETGLIFGVYELAVGIMSPVFGMFVTQLGPKFLFCAGVLLAGSCNILFGFFDRLPDGPIFIFTCFMTRTLEGVGAAAFVTASYAIMAHTFPTNVASMFGILQLCLGVGLMMGSPIGGALFQVGGFLLPFVLSGCLTVILGLLSIFLLPSVQDLTVSKAGCMLSLLRIPLVTIMGFYLAAGAAAIGFLNVGLSLRLQSVYSLTPLKIGFVFAAAPGVYAVTAACWGHFGDTHPSLAKTMLIVGYILGGMAFIMLGPAPFIPLPQDNLGLLIAMLGLAGFGIASMVMIFLVLTIVSRDAGYPDSLETYGMISGIYSSFFCIGTFIGPLLGGYLIDQFDFPTASVFVAGAMSLMAAILAVYMITERLWKRSVPTNDERKRLLATNSVEMQVQTTDSRK